MVKKMFSVESVNENTQKEMIAFLKHHENYSLFLLANFEKFGATRSEQPYSGNFKLIRSLGEIVSVFCLSKKGSLFIQSIVHEPVFEIVLASCLKELLPLTGLVGDWNFCHLFWKFLKHKGIIQKETFASKEILYAVDLSNLSHHPQTNVRSLLEDDHKQWMPLRLDYLRETGFPNNLSEEQLLEIFIDKCKRKIIWGYFIKDQLLSVADLNAKASDVGQLGGVYTDPNFRKKGYSKAVIHKLLWDIKTLHNIRKLVIFTGEKNFSAQKLYESFSAIQVGHFALLFGS